MNQRIVTRKGMGPVESLISTAFTGNRYESEFAAGCLIFGGIALAVFGALALASNE